MKVTSVELTIEGLSQEIVLSYRNPQRTNPYVIKAITGLDADEIIPRYYGGSDDDSTKYYSLGLEKRTLVMRIGLNPSFLGNDSFSSLRDDVYRMISASRAGSIEVQFRNGPTIVAVVPAFIVKFEAPLFNKEPEIQLTLKCLEPMFRSKNRVNVDVSSFNPASMFVNDDISTAPHGFLLEMEVLNSFTDFIIEPPDGAWSFQVTPWALGGYEDGDIIHFSSEMNNKYFYIMRGLTKIHLADSIVPGSVWPLMFYGENYFDFTDAAKLDFVSISHYNTFWGI